MPQSLITTRGDAGQALQVGGRVLSSAHEQIVATLRNRLGQNHGELLAQPRAEADGGIAWSTALTGPVVPAAQLPEDERAKLQQRVERMLGEIRGLAQQLRNEGPASQQLAQMLERATQLPPGDWLYSVGGRPVLAMWGHAAPGAVPPAAAVPVAAAAAAATVVSPAAAAAAATPAAAAATTAGAPPLPPAVPPAPPAGPGKPWKRRLLWGLLALLLLGLLGWGLKRCSEQPPQADAGLAEQIAQAEARNRALEDELTRQRGKPAQMQCVPDAPPPAPSPPSPAPSAPAVEAVPPPPPPASTAAPPRAVAKAPPVASAPAAPSEAPRAAASAAPAPPAAPRQACKGHQPGDEPEVIMIVDASASMRQPFGSSPSRLDAAKRAAEAMIRSLPAEVDVGLVDFGACGQVRRDKFYPAAQRGALVGEINALAPKQGTPLAEAIRRAGAVASETAPSVLIVVSDGGDSCGGDPCAMARSLKAAKPNVTINVLDLSESPRERQVLQCVATAGGGRLLSPGDPADMNRKMKDAAGAANCPP